MDDTLLETITKCREIQKPSGGDVKLCVASIPHSVETSLKSTYALEYFKSVKEALDSFPPRK